MQPPSTCQACRQSVSESRLAYKKGGSVVHREGFLKCDICERYACADCLEVYDIFSGYDFLCHACALTFSPANRGERGH